MSKPQAVVALLDLVEDPDLGPLRSATELGPHCGSGFTRLPSAVDVVPAGTVVLRKSGTEPAAATAALLDSSIGTEKGPRQANQLL